MNLSVRNNKAFSLIEIMVVIFIIGLLLAVLGPRVIKFLGKGEKAAIKLKLNNIKTALTEYRMATGEYPSSREGLQALVENPKPNDERYRRLNSQWPFLEGGDDSLNQAGVPFEYNRPPVRFKDKYKFYEVIYPGESADEEDMQETGA